MIKKELDNLSNESVETIEVKKILLNIAKNLSQSAKKGYKYCLCANKLEKIDTDQFEVDPREWLYDVLIIKQKIIADFYYFAKAIIAVECEWGNREAVIFDFQKLLCCRCDNKIMIFDKNQDKNDDLFGYMEKNIKIWKEKPNTYLLARWVGQKFDYKII